MSSLGVQDIIAIHGYTYYLCRKPCTTKRKTDDKNGLRMNNRAIRKRKDGTANHINRLATRNKLYACSPTARLHRWRSASGPFKKDCPIITTVFDNGFSCEDRLLPSSRKDANERLVPGILELRGHRASL